MKLSSLQPLFKVFISPYYRDIYQPWLAASFYARAFQFSFLSCLLSVATPAPLMETWNIPKSEKGKR
jgi:hypothetical protein